MWEGVTVVKKCDSPKEVCQLVGKCDGHGEKSKGHKVYHLARRSVTVIREG